MPILYQISYPEFTLNKNLIVDGLNTVSKERYLLAHDLRLKSLHHLVETGLNLKFKLRKSKINIIHLIRNLKNEIILMIIKEI